MELLKDKSYCFKNQKQCVAIVDTMTDEREFVQLKTLRRLYDLGRTAAYALVKAMEQDKKHGGGVLRLSQNLVLINLKEWEQFLFSLNRLYLKK